MSALKNKVFSISFVFLLSLFSTQAKANFDVFKELSEGFQNIKVSDTLKTKKSLAMQMPIELSEENVMQFAHDLIRDLCRSEGDYSLPDEVMLYKRFGESAVSEAIAAVTRILGSSEDVSIFVEKGVKALDHTKLSFVLDGFHGNSFGQCNFAVFVSGKNLLYIESCDIE